MKQIRIGIMNDLFGAIDLKCCGGLQRVALYELEGLLKKNCDVLLYTGQLIGKHDKIRKLYFPWYSLSGKNKPCSHVNNVLEYLYAALNSMLFYFFNMNRDILLFMNATPVGLIKPKKSLVHLQVPPNLYFNKFYKLYRIFKTRFVDAHYLFCSKAMLDEYSKEYPWIKKKGFVLYNGVDIEKFRPMQKTPSQRVKFFFASHWSEDKGVFVLLKAAEILEKKRKDFEVILGGSPYVWYRCNIPEEQKETYLMVEEFVKKSATIKILGEVNHDDLPKTYAAMDVYVCPSIWEEPFGLVNIEAMACGLPVIGSIAGGIPEIVIDKETGLLVEKDNPGELAKAMEYFLNNREQIHTMGTAARHRVENKFSWEKHIDRLTEILNKINDSYS